jgi:YD repeat-containing protein
VGRVTTVGAGAGGTTDPVEYAYDTGHGALSAVTYTNGGGTTTVTYQYNAAGRLTKLLDWRHATNGIVFAYDNAGRLTKETDQVRASRHIGYAYDARAG